MSGSKKGVVALAAAVARQSRDAFETSWHRWNLNQSRRRVVSIQRVGTG